MALVIINDKIKTIENGIVQIPNDGYLIVGDNNLIKGLKKKDKVTVEWKSEPDWSEIKEAISGGPYLIMDGKIFVDTQNQKFKFAKKDTYAPRSAIGLDYNNKLYFIAIDGRRNNHSTGLTLMELAEFLKKLNLKEAINLDGGGSTALYADGKIISVLSERHERKISNALLLHLNHHF